jgi:hypothetical protein
MEFPRPPKARVIATIPVERVDLSQGDGSSVPTIGDIAEVDHMFTESGKTMMIVVCFDEDGRVRWVADMFEHEIEPVPRSAGAA